MRDDVQKIVQEALYRAATEMPTPTMVVSQGALEHIVDIARGKPFVPVALPTLPADGSAGQRLRWARKAAGLSAGELGIRAARAMGRDAPYAASAIRNQENGTNGIRPDMAAAYAGVLGVSPGWLLYGEGDGPAAPTAQAALIQTRLDALGLNATAAEKRAGLNAGYVRDILRGKTKRPSAEGLAKLADALQCDVKELLP